MKIGTQALDAYQRTMATAPSTAVKSPQAAASTATAAAPQEAATAQFSKEAQALVAKASEGYDAQKVQALKSQVANGTYQVDSRLVASRMVDQLA